MAEKIREFLTRGTADNVVVVGPVGSGKSHVVSRLADDLRMEIVWMSSSLGFGVDFAAQVAQTRTAFSNKEKVLVYEELEAMSPADLLALAKIPVKVCVLAHTLKGRTGNSLPKGFSVVDFPRPGSDDVRRILRTKFPELPEAAVAAIVDGAKGDIRAALTAASSGFHERIHDAPQGVDLALDILRYKRREFDVPDPTAVSACHENYVLLEGITMEDAKNVSEAFSLGDLMDVSAEALPEAHELGLRAVALVEAPFAGEIQTFGTVWSKASTAAAKFSNVLAIRRAMGATPLGVEDYAFPRAMVLNAVAKKDYALAAGVAVNAGLDAGTLLWMMRLAKSKYTLASHNHVKLNMSRRR